jgi:hypothetical protein
MGVRASAVTESVAEESHSGVFYDVFFQPESGRWG